MSPEDAPPNSNTSRDGTAPARQTLKHAEEKGGNLFRRAHLPEDQDLAFGACKGRKNEFTNCPGDLRIRVGDNFGAPSRIAGNHRVVDIRLHEMLVVLRPVEA